MSIYRCLYEVLYDGFELISLNIARWPIVYFNRIDFRLYIPIK